MRNGPVPVLVFCRTPQPGRVKRRLIAALGADGAARLHQRMTARTVNQALAADVGPVQVWCTPTVKHIFFDALERDRRIALKEQSGNDLGARMHHAFLRVLAEFEAAILVGSDCPGLTVEDFRSAALHLTGRCHAVLTPTEDGGYALIGLSQPAPELFRDVCWGSPKVLETTRARLSVKGYQWTELPIRRDIDRPEDLRTLDAHWFSD